MGFRSGKFAGEIRIFKKLVSRRKHEVFQNVLVNGCSDIGFQKMHGWYIILLKFSSCFIKGIVHPKIVILSSFTRGVK